MVRPVRPLLLSSPRSLALAALLAGAPAIGRAATFTWDGGSATTANWSDPANWSPDGAPPAAVDTALNFAGATRLNNTQDAATPFVLNALNFTDNADAFILGGNGLNFQTASDSVTPTIRHQSASNVTIANALTLIDPLGVGASGTGSVTLSGRLLGTPLTGRLNQFIPSTSMRTACVNCAPQINMKSGR